MRSRAAAAIPQYWWSPSTLVQRKYIKCGACCTSFARITDRMRCFRYSCAAWSVITSCNVHCNRPASLQALRSVGKFPTALLSTDDHQHLQLLEPGHQPDPSSVLLRNFKLLLPDRRLWGNALDEQAGVWRYVDDTSHADSTGGLDETIMVTKYLTQLFNKALNMAKADFPEYSSNVKGVVTYPACFEKDNKAWRDYEYATEMADFGVPIHYMTEHEAALKAALAAQPSPLWDKVWVCYVPSSVRVMYVTHMKTW